MSTYFWKMDDFWQIYEGLYLGNYKKSVKNYVFGVIPSMKVPFNFCPQKLPFLEHSSVNISGTACPNLKSKPIPKSAH